MTQRQISPQETFEVATVRVSKMIYLPSISASEDAYPDVFANDFVDDMPSRADAQLYAALPKLKRFQEDEDGIFTCAEEIAYELHGTPGFLIEAETPAKHFSDRNGSFSYSWGDRYCEWLYAPDEASIATVCAAWAEAMDAEDKARTAKPVKA